ncbi:hypothetical protein RUM43_009395 [Polyplax serrata]|uniref:LRRCT domain-containing protein n=1 Tax=Polyplax serrata TaxID=468196 RepID=A0AAN8PIE5_POLSC
MKMRRQDAEGWCLLVSVLLFTRMTLAQGQFCPSPETILPCTCNTVDGEIQVWCTFSGLKNFMEALRSLETRLPFTISEMILESNNLPSLPGKTFEGIRVSRLMLRDNGLERVTSNWLATLENSLLELFVVEPRLRTLPEDAFDHLLNLEAITLQGGLIKRAPRFSSLHKLRYLQLYSPVLGELFPDNFENLPSLEQLHIIGSPLLNKLDAKIMKNLNKLSLLNVSNCGLTWVHPKAFLNLQNLREIDLSNNRLIDAGIIGRACRDLVNLQVLNLHNNFIDRLSENSFVDLPSLREVYLSQNMISEIQKGVFKNTPSLKILDLSKNSLKRINPNAFSYPSGATLEELLLTDNQLHLVSEMKMLFGSLPRLKFLDLSRNLLEQIPFDTLRGHPTLERLHLDENKILRIPRKAFSGMAALRELRLRNNSLQDFTDGPHWNLPFLKGLDLSQNQIRRLDSNLLTYLPSLRRLDLSENLIETVMSDSFIGNLELETINLSKNFISSFHALTFIYLPKLFELDAGWNRLREVVPGLPKNIEYLRLNKNQIILLPNEMDLPALRLLDLSGNLLRVVYKNTFRTMTRLQWLYLNDNSLDNVEAGAMSGLSKLELLNIRNNRLRMFDDRWLENSKELTEINAHGNLIEGLSTDFLKNSPNLKVLQLSNNKIADIKPRTFSNARQLQELNLANNLLNQFPEAFQNLHELKFLDVSFNNIRSMQPFALQSLPSLRELRMSNNRLDEIPPNTFKDLLNLEFLDLNDNMVEIVSSGAFHSLPSLIAIRLSKNKLSRLPEEAFIDLPELQSAELQFNRIFEVPENAFVNVPRLTYLNLSNNDIVGLDKSGIRELKSLEVLDLSNNKVSWIEGRSFYGMEWLVELKMDNNLICNIRGAPFNHLSRLRVLSLRSNRMTSLAEFAFQKLRNNVAVLDVDGNPLSCSCKMLWLLSWLEDNQSEGPRCADGSLFRDARLSRTECSNSRIVEPVIPGCEGDTVQSSVIETAQLTALTSNLKNSTQQGLLPHETEYFYDEYIEYQYEEPNGTVVQQEVPSTTEGTSPVTQNSYHFATGDTPTLYASTGPPTFNISNPGLGLNDLKKAQQQQQSYNGLTFFGIPLPSLSFGNLWKGNSGRSVDQTQNRNAFAVGKVQPVTKKLDGKNPSFQNFVKPQMTGGFVPMVPTSDDINGNVLETITGKYHPTQPNQGIVTPVQPQKKHRNSISEEIVEQPKPTVPELSTEAYSTNLHLNTDIMVPSEENSSSLEVGTLPPWSILSVEEPKFTVPDYDYTSWNPRQSASTKPPSTTHVVEDVLEVEAVNKPIVYQGGNNWYFENYNKTNLEPFIGINGASEALMLPWAVQLTAVVVLASVTW